MKKSLCPLCNKRRARRVCPALNQDICAICCGTKRITEIDCPKNCTYLQSANAHPPAIVQRQQQRDLRFLLPVFRGLTERQHQILFLLQTFLVTGNHNVQSIDDSDIEEAARALANTYETADRGIVYDHSATGVNAQRLAIEFKNMLQSKQSEGLRLSDRDLAAAFRRLEAAAKDAEKALADDRNDRAYLDLLKRMLKESLDTANSPDDPTKDTTTKSGLIVTGE
mgnify:CR=1 FL=1